MKNNMKKYLLFSCGKELEIGQKVRFLFFADSRFDDRIYIEKIVEENQ